MNKNSQNKLLLVLVMLTFGSIGIFVKYILMPSSVIVFCRSVISVVFLFAYSVIAGKPMHIANTLKKHPAALIFSGVCLAANWIMLFEAYRFTTIATATLCYYMAPVFLIACSYFLFKEKIGVKKAACSAVAVAGMFFVSEIPLNGLPKQNEIKGILLGLGSAILYAVIVLINKKVDNVAPQDKNFIQFSVAAAAIFPYIFLTGDISEISSDTRSVVLIFVVGVFHTGIVYLIYFDVLNKLPAQSIAIISYVDPASAIIFSALILGEIPSLCMCIGAVLILGSAMVSELKIKSNLPNKKY